jgi:elongation factor 1 alpha-like protein
MLEPPTRDISSAFRLPVSNVFRGQGASIAVAGRLCTGIVQVGERVRIVPGDESAVVKGAFVPLLSASCTLLSPEIAINVEEQSMRWAAAGSNVTMYLISVDPVHLGIGSVLCPTTDVVPLATLFTARIMVFDVIVPIAAGASVWLL